MKFDFYKKLEIDKRNKKIIKLYKTGWKSNRIGKKIGLTNGRVSQILRQFGCTPQPQAKIDERDVRRRHADGLTNSQLAAEFSVTPSAIARRLVRLGLERNQKPRKISAACSVENCQDSISRRGYCRKHYERFLKYGSPLIVNKAGRPKQ